MKKSGKHKKQGEKRKHPEAKSQLHSRSKHKERYDFPQLIKSSPALASFVKVNEYGDESINFFEPHAVKALNKALLLHHYELDYWDIPSQYLCPPIPGRADYLHYMADVLAEYQGGKVPKGPQVKCLDIGVGANCVYPLIGHKTFGWSFVGSDIDPAAIEAAQHILDKNAGLNKHIELRLQQKSHNLFPGIIRPGEKFDLCISNPPFHSSQAEAEAANLRKNRNLKGKKSSKPRLNFSGQSHELWCEGGEVKFVGDMIRQSLGFAKDVRVFSSLVAKEVHLEPLYRVLKKVEAVGFKTLPMGQGNKKSRILVWTFLSREERLAW